MLCDREILAEPRNTRSTTGTTLRVLACTVTGHSSRIYSLLLCPDRPDHPPLKSPAHEGCRLCTPSARDDGSLPPEDRVKICSRQRSHPIPSQPIFSLRFGVSPSCFSHLAMCKESHWLTRRSPAHGEVASIASARPGWSRIPGWGPRW